MRIVSLLPAATEIVDALGAVDQIVGISHECDYPPEIAAKPRVTHCEIHDAGLSSTSIDRWVSETLAAQGTLYTIDEPLLRSLAPDLILTQRLCDVCAVGYGSVAALAASLPSRPRVLNLEPSCLSDIFNDIAKVAQAIGCKDRGEAVVDHLRNRVERVRERAALAPRKLRCFLMEWVDPPYCSGHWGPELVEIAGGEDRLGRRGSDSVRVGWPQIVDFAPEVMVVAACGYTVARALEDLPILQAHPEWDQLPAVHAGRVYFANGCAFFSRPGPRIIDSIEILAEALHPELFAGCFPDRGVVSLESPHHILNFRADKHSAFGEKAP